MTSLAAASKLWACALLAFAPLTWGGNLIVGRTLADAVDPTTLNLIRWGGAAILLALLCGPSFWRHRRLIWRHRGLVLALGLTGIGGFHLLQYSALAHTSVLNVALLTAMTPLYVVGLAWLVSGDRVSRAHGWGVGLSILGALVIVSRADPANLTMLDVRSGDLIQLVAMLLWSLYTVLLRYRPQEIPSLPFLLATIVPGLVLSVSSYPLGQPQLDWSTDVALGLAYLVVFPSTLAYIAWSAGVRALGPQAGGAFTNLVPVYGVVLAVLLLGEPLRFYHVMAAVLVALGIWLVSRPAPS